MRNKNHISTLSASLNREMPSLTITVSFLFCLQVQIYELEEHKIETWRGLCNTTISSCSAERVDEMNKDLKKHITVHLDLVVCVNDLSVPLLAEIYLEYSINRLISITPDCR